MVINKTTNYGTMQKTYIRQYGYR